MVNITGFLLFMPEPYARWAEFIYWMKILCFFVLDPVRKLTLGGLTI